MRSYSHDLSYLTSLRLDFCMWIGDEYLQFEDIHLRTHKWFQTTAWHAPSFFSGQFQHDESKFSMISIYAEENLTILGY